MSGPAGEQLALFPGPRRPSRQTDAQKRARAELAEARRYGLQTRRAQRLAHLQQKAA
jgi:hypothetical protein